MGKYGSRAHEWFDTTRPQMKQFIALSLVKPEISDYWSTSPLLKWSIFNSVMPRKGFGAWMFLYLL